MSGKPAIKFFLKAKAQDARAKFIDICAAWRNENGMLGARFDRRVVAVKLDDGTVLKIDDRGGVEGYFFNAREEEGAAPAKAGYTRTAPVTRKPAAGMPADDFDADDFF